MVETARELQLKMQPEDVTELLQSHHITWMDEDLPLLDENIIWFLEMKSIPGEDAMKNIEMTIKSLE